MNNPDLISRSEVLEALNRIYNRAHEDCYANGGGSRYDDNNDDRDIVLNYIQSSDSQPPETSLEKELESLPKAN